MKKGRPGILDTIGERALNHPWWVLAGLVLLSVVLAWLQGGL